MSRNLKSLSATFAVAALTLGCGSNATGPQANLVVRFTNGLNSPNGSMVAGGGSGQASFAQTLSIAGTNGSLVLDDIRIVVAEFELRQTGNCSKSHKGDGGGGNRSGCGKFETPPAFIALPLEEEVVPVVQADIPAGIYSSIEFEVENLRVDDDDDEGTVLVDLLAEIRNEFPDWPDRASMLAIGTFTPTDGAPVPFRVYFEAEIEIKMSFAPPIIVEADQVGTVVDVTVDPRFWFFHGNGTVTDLSALDFDTTGELVEFEFEMKNGFVRAGSHH